jgi:hypothetical protein
MTTAKSLDKFKAILASYENALANYTEEEFSRKPSPDDWSIGQMYQHLVGSLQYFHAKQVEMCLDSADNASQGKTMPGRITYFIGGMLPIRIKVPPSPQYTPPQPENKQKIKDKLPIVLELMEKLHTRLESEQPKGKTKHPAFGYLNAKEWYLLVEMHFRHHLRQKARLDKFLGK